MLDTGGTPIIVTGASRGIGREVSLLLAQRGLPVVLCARAPGPLADAAAQCSALGAPVREVAGDVAMETTCRALIREAADLGGLYGVIHAAGVLHPGPRIWELQRHPAGEVWQASVLGALCMIRSVVPHLLRQGKGLVVLFGSGLAEMHLPGLGVYGAAKACEEYLGRQLMAEAPQVHTVVFRPGLVDTRMQSQARHATGGAGPELRRRFAGFRDAGRLLSPQKAAAALLAVLDDLENHAGNTVSASQVLAKH